MIEFISRLPQGYQEVEYIESSGTQYINTEYKPTSNNLRIACEFEYTADHSDSSVFGSESSSKYSIVPYGAPGFYVGSSTQLLAQTTALNTKYLLDAHANAGTLTVSLNGTTNSASYSGSILTTVNIGVFCNIIAGVANQFCSMRLYAMSIYDNGNLVRNFVPCYRNSDHTAGLYDLSNNVFYANAGSGVFAVGSNVGEIVITLGGVMPFAAALRRRMMAQKESNGPYTVILKSAIYPGAGGSGGVGTFPTFTNKSYICIDVQGTLYKYDNLNTDIPLVLERGEVVIFYLRREESYGDASTLTVDGVVVKSNTSEWEVLYEYVVTSDCEIQSAYYCPSGSMSEKNLYTRYTVTTY